MAKTSTGMSTREKVLIAVAAVAVLAFIGAVAYHFATATPSDAAAKYNGNQYVYEDEVTEYIETYRTNYGLTEDSDFISFLNSTGYTVTQFREAAINEIILRNLVEDRAKELGLTVTDAEVNEYYASIVGDNDTSEGSMWSEVLKSAGLTEEKLKENYHYILLQDKVLSNDVAVRDATDDEVLEYVQENLGGSTQMLVSHIVFTGDDAADRAAECYSKLTEAQSAGTLTEDYFIQMVQEYSDEENASSTKGVVGWTGCGKFSDGVIGWLSDEDYSEDITTGYLLGPVTSTEGESTYEIAYVNDTFTFPEGSTITSLSDLNIPADLLSIIRSNAQTTAWQSDCSSYLSKLINSVNVTYCSMPANASYNVQ